MLTTACDARGARAPSGHRGSVASLKFRDRLRIEFDGRFRDCFLKVSGYFTDPLTVAWKEIRRDAIRSFRPWSLLLRTIDEAVRMGATLDSLLELSSILETYIRIRYEQYQLPTVAAQIEAEENAPVSFRRAA